MKPVHAILLFTIVALQLSLAADPQEKPEVIKKVNPVYPHVYLLAGIEGEVYVHATIDESGKVEKVEVVKATEKGFGPAAIDAIKQWEFKPATLDGKPIKTEVTIPVRFRLGDAALPAGELVTVRERVTKFLEGGPSAELLSMVDSSAYAVVGGKYASLLGLLKDKTTASTLCGGTNEVLMSHLKTDAANDAAFMMLKTSEGKLTRFHTIVLMKGENGTWKIMAWHVSSMNHLQ